jgi:hypothetical protein
LTNNEEWEDFCSEAGRASGDLSFPIVYAPELHFPEFTSAVADMKNSVMVSFSFITSRWLKNHIKIIELKSDLKQFLLTTAFKVLRTILSSNSWKSQKNLKKIPNSKSI